jgi:hypothetical protein
MNCGAKPMAGISFCPGCGASTTPLTEVCTNCGVQVGKAIKERTWKPKVAGILCIVAGTIVVVISGIVVAAGLTSPPPTDADPAGYLMMIFFFGPSIILGIIAIVGGIYALRRRVWGLALVGSICALIVPVTLVILVMSFSIDAGAAIGEINLTIPEILAGFTILAITGILAIIFVIMGKREFK